MSMSDKAEMRKAIVNEFAEAQRVAATLIANLAIKIKSEYPEAEVLHMEMERDLSVITFHLARARKAAGE